MGKDTILRGPSTMSGGKALKNTQLRMLRVEEMDGGDRNEHKRSKVG